MDIMKKKLFCTLVVLAWLLPCATLAQTAAQARACIVFAAKSNEVFVVYVDGIPYGDITYNHTQQLVTLTGLATGVHEITVRLIRPTNRVAHATIDYLQQTLCYSVRYDAASGSVSLLTESNMVLPSAASPSSAIIPSDIAAEGAAMPPAKPSHIATDADVLGIIGRMKKTTFESDKLQLAKSFVKGKHVSTTQAIQIAQSLRFESKRLDFLLYTYDYCYDPENYYKTADILNFNSNKQKLFKRIQHSSPRQKLRPHRQKSLDMTN